MNEIVNPILLYLGCAVGAIGVVLALPRRGVSPQIIGGLLAGGGIGAIFLAIGLGVRTHLPNFNFYVFSFIALGAALRVISHPRPVYAALYFILTILASCGLYVLLAAEFLAFALIIVYAGAILITYLFVIMLATEAPSAEEEERLADYDHYSREPVIATVAGFVLLATLTTILAHGAQQMPAADQTVTAQVQGVGDAAVLAQLPKKVEKALHATEDPSNRGHMMIADDEIVASVNVKDREATVVKPTGAGKDGPTRVVPIPAGVDVRNIEGVAFTLLNAHPGAIEIAGVILLMAMLGAVVLARKKVEMDDAAKLAQQKHLVEGGLVVELPPGYAGGSNGTHLAQSTPTHPAASGASSQGRLN